MLISDVAIRRPVFTTMVVLALMTLGLLGAIPRLDIGKSKRLTPIPGLPPDLANPPQGCPFVPRCPFRIERCLTERPAPRLVAENHYSACWLDVDDLRSTHHGPRAS